MDVFWSELTFGLPDSAQLTRIIIRLVASALIAGLIGYQRQAAGKSAGFRTHILVSLGATIFVIAGLGAGLEHADLSRIIQGIVTGIGFIGAGTILKDGLHVRGLTTSAGLWATCAIGVVVGLGELGIALIAGTVVFVILTFAKWIDYEIDKQDHTTN